MFLEEFCLSSINYYYLGFSEAEIVPLIVKDLPPDIHLKTVANPSSDHARSTETHVTSPNITYFRKKRSHYSNSPLPISILLYHPTGNFLGRRQSSNFVLCAKLEEPCNSCDPTLQR